MIDLTPLDVRNKRGDFKKLMRGYDPQEVDVFLELAAERLEGLVRENLQMRDRLQTLQKQVDAQTGREQAVQDALVTAQELRKDIREQAQREADHLIREAESEARRVIAEAEGEARARLRSVERQVDDAHQALQEAERRRVRFLQEFRGLLQRELDVVEVEEERAPAEERSIDLDLGSGRAALRRSGPEPAEAERAAEVEADRTAGVQGDRPVDVGVDRPAEDVDVDRAADLGGEGVPDRDLPPRREFPDGSGDIERTGAAPRDTAAEGRGERSDAEVGGARADGVGSASERRLDTPPVDVADLQPEGHGGAPAESLTGEADHGAVGRRDQSPAEGRPVSSPAEGRPADDSPTDGRPPDATPADGSSPLELEAAGSGGGGASVPDYPDVPDLETVLAEAGMDEVKPPPADEVASPRAIRRAEDSLILFDQDDDASD